MGSHFPPYFPLFSWSAAGSASLVDFLIFHTGQLPPSVTLAAPDNVKFIDLKDAAGFVDVHARVATVLADGTRSKQDVENLKKILTAQFQKHPYTLVEYKPAYGHIFAEYLKPYTHWGYGDLDMVFGDIPSWVSDSELNDWDIVTYSHGDQSSVYLR